MIAAVIFDLDGVLIDSERVWDQVREEVTGELGGRWHERAQRDMMGMSSTEWSRYMHDELGVPLEPDAMSAEVVRRVAKIYREDLPLIDGAREAVRGLAARWPLGVASSGAELKIGDAADWNEPAVLLTGRARNSVRAASYTQTNDARGVTR